MANETVIATFEGSVGDIQKIGDQWKVVINRNGGGSTVYILDVVYVLPCQVIHINDLIGLLKKGDEAQRVDPFRLLGNPYSQRQTVVEIPIGRFLRFTPNGYIEVDMVIVDIAFEVGFDSSSPQAGDVAFVLKDTAGNLLTGKKIDVYRETDFLHPNRHYLHDDLNALVTMVGPGAEMEDEESFFIRVFPKELFEMATITPISAGPPPPPPPPPTEDNIILINVTDALLINGVDRLLFGVGTAATTNRLLINATDGLLINGTDKLVL